MKTRIKLSVKGEELYGELHDSATAKALLGRLPLSVRMSRWGDEYYGNIGAPLRVDPAPDAREDMSVGELAFWIPGNALCIFFGPTPASSGPEPRAASPVNPVGRVLGDLEVLKGLGGTISLKLELADAASPGTKTPKR